MKLVTALDKLDARWQAGGRICVGLDPRVEKLPKMFQDKTPYLALKAFNRHIINTTADIALAFKADLGPYIKHGGSGVEAFVETFHHMREQAPELLRIVDFKPGGGLFETNEDYAHFAFEVCGADAMTVHPYPGGDAMKAFTQYADKLIFFVCKTSNKGSGEFQDLSIADAGAKPLHQVVAFQVDSVWNGHRNCGLVVGATHPEEMQGVRNYAATLPLLAPGIGKQDGEFEKTIRAGVVPGIGRLIINESRSIIFASNKDNDFAEAARNRLEARTKEYNEILSSMGV